MGAGRVKPQIILYLCRQLTALWETATNTALPYLSLLQRIPHTHHQHLTSTQKLRNKTAQVNIICIVAYCSLLLLEMRNQLIMLKWCVNLPLFKKSYKTMVTIWNYFVDCVAVSFNISILQSIILCFNITVYINP